MTFSVDYECEGRYKGLRTLYADANDVVVNPNEVLSLATFHKVSQLRIADLTNRLSYENPFLLTAHKQGFLVTLERTSLTAPPAPHVHLILRLSAQMFRFLDQTDQIKFEYNNNVYITSKETMTFTHPDDMNVTK